MGNIEIRQQQNKKRPQIFTQRISKTPTKSFVRKSLSPLTQNYNQFSPIKYFKKNNLRLQVQAPLTQRKNYNQIQNTSRLSINKTQKRKDLEDNNQNDFNQTTRQINFHKKSPLTPNRLDSNKDKIFSSISLKKGAIVPNTLRYKKQQQNQFQQNRQQKCVQIIKKVRNFNDFLNQIKRKLKEQSHLINNHQMLHSSRKKHVQNENNKNEKQQDQRQQRKIQISLKLENEKLELEKYRNLVERQLSKNHSIQNITLSTKKSGEKVLTIQYQSLNSSESSKNKLNPILIQQNNLDHQQQSKQSQLSQRKNKSSHQQKLIKKQKQNSSKQPQINQKTIGNKSNLKQKNSLISIKTKFKDTMSKMQELGGIIQKLQQQQKEQHKSANTSNIQTIANLLNKMDVLQEECLSTDRWIKEYMEEKGLSKSKNQQKYIKKIQNNFNQSSLKYQLSSEEEEGELEEEENQQN